MANSGKKSAAAQRKAQSLTAPLLKFDLGAEIEKLHGEESWHRTGRNAKTLVKHPDFRIVLTVVKAGERCQEHRADARVSIQTVEGHVRLHLPKGTVDLPAGHLLALDRSLPHDVEAIEESAFLLSISWSKGG